MNPLVDASHRAWRSVVVVGQWLAVRGGPAVCWVETASGTARSILLSGLVVFATGLVGYAVVTEVFNGSFLIDPITVPDEFGKRFSDKDGVAAQLQDQVGAMAKAARTGVAVAPVVFETNEPQVSLTGTNLPLRYFATLLRDLFGHRYARITGELSFADVVSAGTTPPQPPRYRLVLRAVDSVTGPLYAGEGYYPDLVKAGAWEVLKKVDPYSAAGFLGQEAIEDRPRALALITDSLASTRAEEHPLWAEKLFGFKSDVPRAYLTEGNIRLSMNDIEGAKKAFLQANVEYASRRFDAGLWYAAYDGIATARLVDHDYAGAQAAAETALNWQSGYDSALYHRAQSYDFRSSEVLRDFGTTDTCAALKNFDAATNVYAELYRVNPNFAVAYAHEGVLLLQELAYIKTKRRLGCPARELSEADLRAKVSDLEKQVEDRFSNALARDSEQSDAWFQWGILLYQEQNPALLQAEGRDAGRRRHLLDAAVVDYNHALRIKPSDGYVWRLLGEALAARGALTIGPEAADYLDRAVAAFCVSSVAFTDPTERHTSIAAAVATSWNPDACDAGQLGPAHGAADQP